MRWSRKLLLVTGTQVLAAAASAAEPPFPLDDEARIEAGRRRFGRSCAAYCHGAEGSGGRAPAFKGNTRLTPDDAFKTITDGPPRGRHHAAVGDCLHTGTDLGTGGLPAGAVAPGTGLSR